MEPKVFKPKYPSTDILSIISLILLEAFLLHEFLSSPDIITGIWCAGVLVVLIAFPLLKIRRIVLGNDSLTIERYLLPPKEIGYHQITDVGNTIIATQQGQIPLNRMTNAKEFVEILHTFIEEGKISKHQIKGSLVKQEKVARKAIWISLLLTWVLNIILAVFFPAQYDLLKDWWLLVLFVPIYALTVKFLKARSAQA